MERKDWLLLAIGESMSPIQIQKTLFKFTMESGIPPDESYEFVPYNWGPCSFGIYDDLHVLREDGLIEPVPSGRGWNLYRVTEAGRVETRTLRKQAEAAYTEELDKLRDWVTSRDFDTLLSDIYREYPDFAKESLYEV